jgi:hypothetical protein
MDKVYTLDQLLTLRDAHALRRLGGGDSTDARTRANLRISYEAVGPEFRRNWPSTGFTT